MPPVGARNEDAEVLADPEVRLSLTGRSGPLVVEIEYRVAQDNARAFHGVMQEVQLSRQRNGAYGWSIARDIADPELWTERYHCPTWLDYPAPAQPRHPIRARAASAAPSIFISGPIRSASAACWSGRSDRCAGRKRPPTAPPTRSCRPPRPPAAARNPSGGIAPGLMFSRIPQSRGALSNAGEGANSPNHKRKSPYIYILI